MALKAWYQLNGNVDNMGTGDLSLTQTTAPTWSTGKTTAKSLNAGAFKWTAAQTAGILNNEEFSYACWFYVDAASGTSASDYKKIFGADGGTNSSNRKFTCGQYPTVNGFHVSSWNGSSLINCCRIDDALPSYQWTHICYSYKKGIINIYINGVLRKSTELTMNNSSYSAETPVIWNYTGRRIQDVRVYDHALSTKEVTELAKGLMLHIPMYAGYTGVGTNIAKNTSNIPTAFTIDRIGSRILQSDTNFYGLQAEDQYTFSIKLTAPAGKSIAVWVTYFVRHDSSSSSTYQVGIGNTIPAGTTGYSSLTATLPEEILNSYDQIDLRLAVTNYTVSADETCYISEMKLEKGSTRTPWIPDASSSQYNSVYAMKDCSGYQVPVGITGNVSTVYGDSPRYDMSGSIYGSVGCIWPIQDPITSSTQEFTISVWFKTATTSGNQCIWNGRNSSSSGNCAVGIFLINSTIRVDDSTSTNVATISANTWYHLAVTWKAGGNKITYVNGVQKSSVAVGTLTKSNTKASIGRTSNNDSLYDGNYFSGQMSDFRIYATALSAANVKKLYDTPISIATNGACLAEQFNEGESSVKFKKTGLITGSSMSELPGKYDNSLLIEPDGSCWMHIGHHADPGTYKFASTDPFTTGVWKDARRFLDPSFCNNVDKWEFIVEQKATSSAAVQRFRWVQQVNPNTATYSNTVAANITRYGTADGYTSSSYGGMYNFGNTSTSYYVCNNGSNGNWYGAIGCTKDFNTGIPGYNGATIKDGGYVDLYIRIDNVTFTTPRSKCSIDKNGKSVLSPSYVEQ